MDLENNLTENTETTENVSGADDTLNLRDTIAKAFKEAESKSETQEEEKPAATRDEKGKFAPKVAETTTDTTVTPAIETPTVKAPESWSPTVKAEWDKLPVSVQQEISKREADIHKGFTKMDEERSFGKQVKDIVNPYMAMIKAEGGNPQGVIDNLLNTAYVLRTAQPQQKTELFRQLAQQYGVDLEQVVQPAPYVDPQLSKLEQELNEMRQWRQQQENLTNTQYNNTLQQEYEAFASNPEHTYANDPEVNQLMIAFLQAGQAKDYKDAYDKALYANPTTRAAMIAKQDAQRIAEQSQKTLQAKAKGSSVFGSPNGAAASVENQNLDLRSTIQQAYRAAMT
jgi:hypothetical protein